MARVPEAGLFQKIEDKYYSFLDWVEEKGIPVYKVVDAIESRNVPSLPVAIVLSLVVLGILFYGAFSVFPQSAELNVIVQDNEGNAVDRALVTAFDGTAELDSKQADSEGKALLKVPVGKSLKLVAKKKDLKDAEAEYTLKQAGDTATITMLSLVSSVKKTISLLSDGTTRSFRDVEVEFSCTGNANFSAKEKSSSGTIEIEVPDDCDTLKAKAAGDYRVTSGTIYLSSDSAYNVYLAEKEGASGNAVAVVKNANGEPVPGVDVSLYSVTAEGDPGTSVDRKQASAAGTATFNSVPVGRYYAVAYDNTGNYSEYSGLSEGSVQEITANATASFAVVLSQNVVGKIKARTKDKATGEAISGATIKLSKGQTEIKSSQTGSDGIVEFSVGEDIEYGIAVDKAGYMLYSAKLRPSNDTREIQLDQATAEKSQALFVTIVDEAGVPVEGVRARLKNNADGSLAATEITTGLDGRASFERLQDGAYYVYAEKPGYGNKQSDPVKVVARQLNTLKLILPIGSGRIDTAIVNSDGKPVTGATVKAVDLSTRQVLQESLVDSDGKKSISVRADKKAFLVVSADGYVTATTAPIAMQKDATIQKTVAMQKSVSSLGIELDGLYSGGEKVSEAGSSLTPGQKYTAKLLLSVPKGAGFEEAGVHIRTGQDESGSVEKDYVYITEVRTAAKAIAAGSTYTPPTGQANDYQNLTSGNAKWANALFKPVVPGTYEIEADLQVRDDARISAPLQLSYRAWGKAGAYTRAPNDAELGSSENSGSKQSLYANAKKRSFSAGPSSLCSDEFCSRFEILDETEGLSSSVVESYAGNVGSKYALSFDITSTAKTPLTQAVFSIKDRAGSIAIDSYTIRAPSGETKTGKGVGSQVSVPAGEVSQDSSISGEITFTAKKEGSVPIEITISSGSGQGSQSIAYLKTLYFKAQSAEPLSMEILPKVLVPFINNNILVKISDGNGQKAISNAVVAVKNNGAVISSGETDVDGIFAYTLSSPSDGATIGILAEKTGYRAVEKELKVTPNILATEPESLRFQMNVGGSEFKTVDGRIKSYAQIPLEIEKAQFTREFEGYAEFSLESPNPKDILAPDSNTTLSAKLTLGPKAREISKPTLVRGALIVQVYNKSFEQRWNAAIPIEVSIGFGGEVDDTACFTLNTADWKISGASFDAKKLEVGLSNACKVGGEKAKLSGLYARIVSGSDNLLGKFSAKSTLEGSKSIELDRSFREIAKSIPEEAEEKLTLEFKPDNIISGKAEARIEVQAIHRTAAGDQKLLQKIAVAININTLEECVEVLAPQAITLNSCPSNMGFGLYGNRFGGYSGSRYSAFDPYTSRYGYGEGNPPWLTPTGTAGNRAPLGMNYYDYQNPMSYSAANPNAYTMQSSYANSFYPNPYFSSQFYTGQQGFMQGYDTTWNCGPQKFQVRNNCTSQIDLSFEAQPGIIVDNKARKVDPGKTEDVTVEPTSFFGVYSLDVKAKTLESNEKAVTVKKVLVNVTNEFVKNYRDCISVDPAGTISFNNFFGKPAILRVRNTCYAQGVIVPDDATAASFATTSAITPTNEDMTRFNTPTPQQNPTAPTGNQATGQGNQPNPATRQQGQQAAGTAGAGRGIGQPQMLPLPQQGYQTQYNQGIYSNNYGNEQFGGLIQSIEFMGSDYQTTPDGRITQVVSFNLIKNVHKYRNNAPPADFFTNNPFKNVGNLRYFSSSGYYAVNARAILFVRFYTPSGMQRSISFPMTLQDFWPLLEYAEKVTEKFTTYGNPNVPPSNCLNLSALDFTRLGDVPADMVLYTKEQRPPFFNISDVSGCGTVDSVELMRFSFEDEKTGLVMLVSPDQSDPKHELEIKFDPAYWNGQRAVFNSGQIVTVTKQYPPSSEKARATIKTSVEADKAVQEAWKANYGNMAPSEVKKQGKPPIEQRPPIGKPCPPDTVRSPATDTCEPVPKGEVKACEITKVQDGQFVKVPAGSTGQGIYNEYGFQHVQYEWGTNSAAKDYVSRTACDANAYTTIGASMRDLDATGDAAVLFCDAMQAGISLSQKYDEVNNVVGAVKKQNAAENGTCSETESATTFDCGEKGNKTFENLHRYVLSQNILGMFLGNDGLLADLSGEVKVKIQKEEESGFKAKLESLRDKRPSKTELPHNAGIMENVTSLVEYLDKDEPTPLTTGIYLELKGWTKPSKAANEYFLTPNEIGALEIDENWYALELFAYNDLKAALKDCTTNECEYAYKTRDTSGEETTIVKKITLEFMQQLAKGKWKIVAFNENDMPQEVKVALMKKARWETGKNLVNEDKPEAENYASFYQFYMENIEPQMYFMKDDYSRKFVELLKADDSAYKGLFSGLSNSQISFSEAGARAKAFSPAVGRYDANLASNWGVETGKQDLEVFFGNYVDFARLGEKYKGYMANPLFKMPIDGKGFNWGTAFTGQNKERFFLEYRQDGSATYEVPAQGNSDYKTMNFAYKDNYADTKGGKILSINVSDTAKNVEFSPSEPVKLTASYKSSKGEGSVGMLMDYQAKGARQPLGIAWGVIGDTIENATGVKAAAMVDATKLCTGQTLDFTKSYEGFEATAGKAGETTLFGTAFMPSFSPTNVQQSITLYCPKDEAKLKAEFQINNNEKLEINGHGQKISLPNSAKDNYKAKYSLKSLAEMVKENKVCVKQDEKAKDAIDFYWNEAAFRQT